ncbi:MAG: hypothetical protein DRG78_00435 [Epsilonproteobacteria bacterium]|nr:MAG: hypothetical protein DRG78_00435 [Campylobacterota bacterium]
MTKREKLIVSIIDDFRSITSTDSVNKLVICYIEISSNMKMQYTDHTERKPKHIDIQDFIDSVNCRVVKLIDKKLINELNLSNLSNSELQELKLILS